MVTSYSVASLWTFSQMWARPFWLTLLRAIVEAVERSHSLSPSPEKDEPNREYLIRSAALGDNPTQEEMRRGGVWVRAAQD